MTLESFALAVAIFEIIKAECGGLDPFFVLAIIDQESSFRTDAIGQDGEIGLMQLSRIALEHLEQMGYDIRDPMNPINNIRLGCAYLRWIVDNLRDVVSKKNLLFYTACAYNAGLNRVLQYIQRKQKPPNWKYGSEVIEKYRFYKQLLRTEVK